MMTPIRRAAALLVTVLLACGCAQTVGGPTQSGSAPPVPGSPGAPPQTGGRY